MPLIQDGESYRSFSEPSLFEAETEAQVKQIELPTNKAFAFVSADDGSSDFEVWKFDSESTDAASSTVLVPNNPLFATVGRWIKMLTGGSSAVVSFLSGHGDPNGSVIGQALGQTYTDLDDGALWLFTGTVGTNTGWV